MKISSGAQFEKEPLLMRKLLTEYLQILQKDNFKIQKIWSFQ